MAYLTKLIDIFNKWNCYLGAFAAICFAQGRCTREYCSLIAEHVSVLPAILTSE